jgi:environmental stress-induced protein Ves
MSGIRLIEADCVASLPWKNGGGSTRELLTLPAPAGSGAPWHLRLSLADITRDGPFSPFPGIARWFAVLEGAGVELQWPGETLRRTRADLPLRFDGADPPGCKLLAGPTRDLNLMVDERFGAFALEMANPQAPMPMHTPAPPPGHGDHAGHAVPEGSLRDAAHPSPRGLFTSVPARLHRAGQPTMTLPALSLLWRDSGERGLWQVEPLADGPQFWITEPAGETP